jgi:hypothetical protein
MSTPRPLPALQALRSQPDQRHRRRCRRLTIPGRHRHRRQHRLQAVRQGWLRGQTAPALSRSPIRHLCSPLARRSVFIDCMACISVWIEVKAEDGILSEMPVSSSTFPAMPPRPSCRMRAMMSRIGMSPCAECVSENIRCWRHRSQVTRISHDGNARNGSSRASVPVGRGSSP